MSSILKKHRENKKINFIVSGRKLWVV